MLLTLFPQYELYGPYNFYYYILLSSVMDPTASTTEDYYETTTPPPPTTSDNQYEGQFDQHFLLDMNFRNPITFITYHYHLLCMLQLVPLKTTMEQPQITNMKVSFINNFSII